jgi:acetylornithine deacetylase
LPHDFPFTSEGSTFSSSGLRDHNNGPLANGLCRTAARVAGKSRPIGVPYGTDATVFSDAGVPSVVFGPGSIDQAHTADEWLSLEQLHLASEIYYRFALEFGKG